MAQSALRWWLRDAQQYIHRIEGMSFSFQFQRSFESFLQLRYARAGGEEERHAAAVELCKARRLMSSHANEKDGEVIEKTYFGMRYRYTWRCAEGHEWKQAADAVLRGIWCPHCSGRHNITLDSLKNLAAAKNIEILTTEYKNNTQKIVPP